MLFVLSNENIMFLIIGTFIGFFLNNNILINVMLVLLFAYMVCIFIVRVFVGFIIMILCNKSIEFAFDDIFRPLRKIIIDNPQIHFNYNIVYNRVIVTRSFGAKLLTDKDNIIVILKRIFDICLYCDILYHYKPLQILFE